MWWLMSCRAAGLQFLEEAPPSQQELPLVVVIHGYGDRPESMLQALRACQLPARILAPRGPEPHPSGEGYAWYRVDFTDRGVQHDAQTISRAERSLVELIEAQDNDRVIVTGFSQGGILSFQLASHHPGLVDAAVPVAGAMPESLLPGPAPAGAPPIRALHGSTDPLLPASDTQKVVQQLAERGWDAQIELFDGVAHQITREVHAAWCRELRRALPDPEGGKTR